MMRDTYEALFTAGHDLRQADMTAIVKGTKYRNIGGSSQEPIQVFKTRMKREVAETIDWANKEALDFNEIWDTLLLNPIWRRELKAAQEGG
jgi:hypothetical protein